MIAINELRHADSLSTLLRPIVHDDDIFDTQLRLNPLTIFLCEEHRHIVNGHFLDTKPDKLFLN